jgi:hypothetical protein
MDGIVLVGRRYLLTNRLLHATALLSLTGLTAYLGWHGEVLLLGAALCLPALWGMAHSRLLAWLIALTYYLLAARDIPAGAAVFFGQGTSYGWLLLIGASLLLSLPYALLWKRNPSPWRFALVMVLVSLPPIGVVGWANPLTAAGVLLPGFGWFGLVATLVVACLISRYPPLAIFCFVVSIATPQRMESPPPGWIAMNTAYQMSSGESAGLSAAQRQMEIIDLIIHSLERVVILPETIVGQWRDSSLFLWEELAQLAEQRGQTIIFGAELPQANGYKNAAVRLTPEGGDLAYQQLMPVPVSMWRPWSDQSALPAWFMPQSVEIEGERAAFLICYEQLLFWPPLVAMSTDPDVLIGMSNDWWARGGDIPAIQLSVLKAWASLFNRSLISVVNK